jgi:hypothetical protein
MVMKKFYILAMALLTVMSCQKNVIQKEVQGSLSLLLENSPVVEVITKAAGDDVPVDDFNVYVSSDDAVFTYVYKDMPSVITVPVGFYTVSAENVTEHESVVLPDEWGQVRYAGASDRKEVVAGLNPTKYSLTCTMVNTAVSVVFGENIDKHFTDYKIVAYTEDNRKLEYTPENTVGQAPAVGYFSSGVAVNYVFTGTYIIGNEPMTITGSKMLQPATHLHLTFRMSQQNGAIGKPEIVVDTTCEDLYETITVDPSEGGSFIN